MMCSCVGDEDKTCDYRYVPIYCDNQRFEVGVERWSRDQCSRDKRPQHSPRTRKLTLYIYIYLQEISMHTYQIQ